MIILAELNEDNICIGVKQVKGMIDDSYHTEIDKYDIDFIGRKYDIKNKVWTDEYLEDEVVIKEPDKVELLGQQLSDMEIQQLEYNLKATQEREFLGQQLSDLEISMLERSL
ncbi:MAG: hypothetical protein GX366_07370 [Epulopiscium sp.]|nr:hypothetical protein [Candidatus Epulonipiscium sp.]